MTRLSWCGLIGASILAALIAIAPPNSAALVSSPAGFGALVLAALAVSSVILAIKDGVLPACIEAPEAALRGVTMEAAYSLQLEDEIGSISPGKRANFTILEENPLTVDPAKIKVIGVWGTVMEGRLLPVKRETKKASRGEVPADADLSFASAAFGHALKVAHAGHPQNRRGWREFGSPVIVLEVSVKSVTPMIVQVRAELRG